MPSQQTMKSEDELEVSALRAMIERLIGRRLDPAERAQLQAGQCPPSLSMEQSIVSLMRARLRVFEHAEAMG